MKVFGIGLNKTGTTTLGRALQIIGFKSHISCDAESLKNLRAGNLDAVFQVIDQYESFEDWPWPLMYQELFEKYDDAKFILTTRKSPEVWFQSLAKHALKKGKSNNRKLAYGYHTPTDNKPHHIDFYNEHNEAVRRFFKENAPDKLIEICWENGDDWEKLCHFLDRPIPNEPIPFLNRAADKKSMTRFQKLKHFYRSKTGKR